MDIETLKFPIGKFTPPEQISMGQLQSWSREIQQLPQKLESLVSGMSDEELNTPYRPGGWTVKQVVHHLADSHANAYIRFHLALTESNPVIKPYKEALWAELPYLQELSYEVSLQLLSAIHQRWFALLSSLKAMDFDCTYTHPEYQRVYTLALATGSYAWHGAHHLAHIQKLVDRNFDRQ